LAIYKGGSTSWPIAVSFVSPLPELLLGECFRFFALACFYLSLFLLVLCVPTHGLILDNPEGFQWQSFVRGTCPSPAIAFEALFGDGLHGLAISR